MSPDRQLLLACCRAHWTPHARDPSLPHDVDWDRLLERAERLGVAALLHTTVTRCVDGSQVPPQVLRRVDHGYYWQAARNARLCDSLEEVLAALSRLSVSAIVLKGASIAELVYGNIALRSMTDLDVLVQPRDLDAAERVVRELGYVPDESSHPAEWYRRCHHHLAPYRSFDGSSIVELHQHIFPPAAGVRVRIEDLWQRARPAALGSGPALVLAPADLLLHLCVGLSAVEHFVGRFRTLCDVAATIRRYELELDWACLLESARVYALDKHLYYALWLARCLVAADVPAFVLQTLKPSAQGHWVEDLAIKSLIQRAVFQCDGEGSVGPADVVSGVLAELLAAKTGSAKVGGLARLAYRGVRWVQTACRLGRVDTVQATESEWVKASS